jgi:hypothetical protein
MKQQLKQGILRVLLGTVALSTTIIAVGLVPTDSIGSGAQTWYRSLTASDKDRLGKPAAIASLPVEYRRMLIPKLSPEQQAIVWRNVLTHFKVTHQLSDEQSALVAKTERLLTPDLFRRRDAKDLAAISDLRAKLFASIGQAASDELFSTAGPAPSHLGLSALETARYEWRRTRAGWPHGLVALIAPVVKAAGGQCDCISNNDCFLSYCGDPNGCTPTSWECGSWFLQGCTALCYYPN